MRRSAVQQRQDGNRLLLLLQLTRHFVRNIAAKAVAAEAIGTLRLDQAKVSDVISGHFFDAGKLVATIKSAGTKRINRLVLSEVAGEVDVTPEHPTSGTVNEEQRLARALTLDFDQRG